MEEKRRKANAIFPWLLSVAFLAIALYAVFLLTISKSVPAEDTFPLDYPSLRVELIQYGKNHPILSDVKSHTEDFVYPARFIDVVEYRGYVFFDFEDGNGCIQLIVYRWDGVSWRYVETTSFCPPG